MDIKIDKRNKTGVFHKVPKGLDSNFAKEYALKDISDYISKKTDFGIRNYIYIESVVLKSIKFNKPFIYLKQL